MSDWYWAQGDTNPIVETLRDAAGNPVDIQGVAGSAIRLTVTPIQGGTAIVNSAAMTNLQVGDGLGDGSRGRVSWTPTAETATPGDYLGRINLTSGSTVTSYPNDGYIHIRIGAAAPTTQGRYLTLEELKKTLVLEDNSYADADIRIAIEAASRGLEHQWSSRWVKGSQGEVRYYTRSGPRTVPLGDVLAVTAIDLDYGLLDGLGPGEWSSALAAGDYRLLPTTSGLATAGGDGSPYRTLELARGSDTALLPSGTDAIRVTGTFGWEQTPAGVKAATTIIATRLLRRTREAPFGIIQVGLEGAAVRAAQIAGDPEVRFAMEGLGGRRRLLV